MRAIVDVGRAAIRMAKLTMQMIERRRERGRGMRRGGEKNMREGGKGIWGRGGGVVGLRAERRRERERKYIE